MYKVLVSVVNISGRRLLARTASLPEMINPGSRAYSQLCAEFSACLRAALYQKQKEVVVQSIDALLASTPTKLAESTSFPSAWPVFDTHSVCLH